jgi:hypothetical protein
MVYRRVREGLDMSEVLPYQQRVIEEANELRDRTENLGLFFETEAFRNLDRDERYRLEVQFDIMMSYRTVLRQRIFAMGLGEHLKASAE